MATVQYSAPGRSRDRILLWGPEGTGKTVDALSIARALPHVTFHWIDNDDTLDRLLETEFTDLGIVAENGEETGDEGNISLWRVEDWDDHIEAFKATFGVKKLGIETSVDRDDWIVLDTGSVPWDAVQDAAAASIYGVGDRDDLTEQRADERRGKKSTLLVFDGEMDYGGKINPEYRTYLGNNLTRPPCHLLVTADVQLLDDRTRDHKDNAMYKKFGQKPRGQKRLGHSAQSVLMKEVDARGRYKFTSVKDRGRELYVGEEIADLEDGGFFETYMKGVAGWKATVVK